MFYYSYKLTAIYVGPNWIVNDDTNVDNMFDYCGVQEVTLKPSL